MSYKGCMISGEMLNFDVIKGELKKKYWKNQNFNITENAVSNLEKKKSMENSGS